MTMPLAGIKKRPLIVGVLVVVVAIAALAAWRSIHRETTEKEIVLHGNVDIRQVDLAFNANERIEKVMAEEGDSVKAGQLLATLDRERLGYEVMQAEARVRAQENVAAALVAGTRPEDIRKARADVAAAEAESTRARLEAAKEALNLAIAGPRKEDIAAAKATLKALKESLAVARRNLSYAYLYAPSDGVIQSRILETGDMASPQKPVFTLALTDPIWVRAYISERDLGKVRPGMTAEVVTDSFPGKRYQAWIGFISPSAQFTPKSVETREVRTSLVYQVRVFVRKPQNELRLGMPATVIIPLYQKPEKAVSPEKQNRP
jgi:HlyD family secretion protein